jgi:hypothetical protein
MTVIQYLKDGGLGLHIDAAKGFVEQQNIGPLS